MGAAIVRMSPVLVLVLAKAMVVFVAVVVWMPRIVRLGADFHVATAQAAAAFIAHIKLFQSTDRVLSARSLLVPPFANRWY